MKTARERRKGSVWQLCLLLFFCACSVALDFIDFSLFADDFYNETLRVLLQRTTGSIAAVLLMIWLKIRLFGRVDCWLYLLPCLLVAVDNFQFYAYFQGKMQWVRRSAADVLLFAARCIAVGCFEEFVFRGVIFSVLAGLFPKDKKGLMKTFFVSSIFFGAAHLLNGFSGATLLQAGYTCLTGGLFAFCLMKTKNILCCAACHTLFNFCGLFFDELGTGSVLDVGTALTMLIVCVAVGAFVLRKVWMYSEEERQNLYARLGVATNEEKHTKEETEK